MKQLIFLYQNIFRLLLCLNRSLFPRSSERKSVIFFSLVRFSLNASMYRSDMLKSTSSFKDLNSISMPLLTIGLNSSHDLYGGVALAVNILGPIWNNVPSGLSTFLYRITGSCGNAGKFIGISLSVFMYPSAADIFGKRCNKCFVFSCIVGQYGGEIVFCIRGSPFCFGYNFDKRRGFKNSCHFYPRLMPI